MMKTVEKQNYCWRWRALVESVQFKAGDTTKTVTAEPIFKTRLRLGVINASSETDLTVEVYEVDEENNYFIDWFVIPKKQTRANGITVEAHTRYLPRLGGGDVKLVISNDTAITTAFNVTVTIREV